MGPQIVAAGLAMIPLAIGINLLAAAIAQFAHLKWEDLAKGLAGMLKVVGIVGIIFIPVFWAFTGRIEFALLPFFGTLAGVGQGIDLLKEISQARGEANAKNEA